MPELGVGEVVVWLMTTAVIVGIPVVLLALVFRLGRRSATRASDDRQKAP